VTAIHGEVSKRSRPPLPCVRTAALGRHACGRRAERGGRGRHVQSGAGGRRRDAGLIVAVILQARAAHNAHEGVGEQQQREPAHGVHLHVCEAQRHVYAQSPPPRHPQSTVQESVWERTDKASEISDCATVGVKAAVWFQRSRSRRNKCAMDSCTRDSSGTKFNTKLIHVPSNMILKLSSF
jgi:hypothetical protein